MLVSSFLLLCYRVIVFWCEIYGNAPKGNNILPTFFSVDFATLSLAVGCRLADGVGYMATALAICHTSQYQYLILTPNPLEIDAKNTLSNHSE